MSLALSTRESLGISRRLVIALDYGKSILKRLLPFWNFMFTSTFWNLPKQGVYFPLAQPLDCIKADSQYLISNLS